MVHRRFFATLFKQISDALWKCYKILLTTHNGNMMIFWTDRLTALYTKNTLSMCAIHSCFSVAVAAYTANDFPFVHINHPFLYWASSSRDCNFTSSNGIICCLLYLKYVKSYLNTTKLSYISRKMKLSFVNHSCMLDLLLFGNDNVSIHKQIVKKKKLSWLRAFSACFCQHSFPNKNTAWDA